MFGPMAINFDVDVYYAIQRIHKIFATEVLIRQNVLTESAFIEVMIRLNDLLQKADSQGHRINFTDDVQLFPGIVKDITEAVREYRDAVSHVRANGHYITPEGLPKPRGQSTKGCSKVTFCVAAGRVVIMQTPRYTIQSEYDNDVCYFYGAHRLYLIRHIKRAFDEAKAALMPHDPLVAQRAPEK